MAAEVAARDAQPRRAAAVGLDNGCVYLYAYGDADGRTVKLGQSAANPFGRKHAHEKRGAHHSEMTTLAVWIGHLSDETYLKNHFKHLAIGRNDGKAEWFTCDDEMRGWLRTMRQQYFVAHKAAELKTIIYVDPVVWLPQSRDRHLKSNGRQFDLLSETPQEPWADIVSDHDTIMEGDFYTPPILLRAARKALGVIDLDPASCRAANSEVLAQRIFDIEQNGLAQQWYGRMWLNPPFPWEPWVGKFVAEWNTGRISAAIALCTTRVTTAQYFEPMIRLASAKVKTLGRHQFWGPKAHAPDEGHEIYYYGSDVRKFADAFAPLGHVWIPLRS